VIKVTGRKPTQPILNCQQNETRHNKNGKLEYKASFVVTQTVMPKHKYRKQMTVIHFKDGDLASGNKQIVVSNDINDMINVAFQQFAIFWKYLSSDETTVKSYARNSSRQFICGKPDTSGCKLWAVYGTDGYCFIYKDGRYGYSNCTAHLQASTCNRCTGPSGLQACCAYALSQNLY
jgi:hypothetical protein